MRAAAVKVGSFLLIAYSSQLQFAFVSTVNIRVCSPIYHHILNQYNRGVVAARCKAWVCGRSLAGIVGSSLAGGQECRSLVSVVCYEVENIRVSLRSPAQCGVSVIVMPSTGCCVMRKKNNRSFFLYHNVAYYV